MASRTQSASTKRYCESESESTHKPCGQFALPGCRTCWQHMDRNEQRKYKVETKKKKKEKRQQEVKNPTQKKVPLTSLSLTSLPPSLLQETRSRSPERSLSRRLSSHASTREEEEEEEKGKSKFSHGESKRSSSLLSPPRELPDVLQDIVLSGLNVNELGTFLSADTLQQTEFRDIKRGIEKKRQLIRAEPGLCTNEFQMLLKQIFTKEREFWRSVKREKYDRQEILRRVKERYLESEKKTFVSKEEEELEEEEEEEKENGRIKKKKEEIKGEEGKEEKKDEPRKGKKGKRQKIKMSIRSLQVQHKPDDALRRLCLADTSSIQNYLQVYMQQYLEYENSGRKTKSLFELHSLFEFADSARTSLFGMSTNVQCYLSRYLKLKKGKTKKHVQEKKTITRDDDDEEKKKDKEEKEEVAVWELSFYCRLAQPEYKRRNLNLYAWPSVSSEKSKHYRTFLTTFQHFTRTINRQLLMNEDSTSSTTSSATSTGNGAQNQPILELKDMQSFELHGHVDFVGRPIEEDINNKATISAFASLIRAVAHAFGTILVSRIASTIWFRDKQSALNYRESQFTRAVSLQRLAFPDFPIRVLYGPGCGPEVRVSRTEKIKTSRVPAFSDPAYVVRNVEQADISDTLAIYLEPPAEGSDTEESNSGDEG